MKLDIRVFSQGPVFKGIHSTVLRTTGWNLLGFQWFMKFRWNLSSWFNGLFLPYYPASSEPVTENYMLRWQRKGEAPEAYVGTCTRLCQ